MTEDTAGHAKQLRTRDLYEAAALYAKNLPLVSMERHERQCWFVFDHLHESKRASDDYWRGALVVSAKDYANAIRTLKDRIFAQEE